jgi:hypothetical protein
VRIASTATLHQPVILDFRNNLWELQPTSQVTGDGHEWATFSDTRTANAAPHIQNATSGTRRARRRQHDTVKPSAKTFFWLQKPDFLIKDGYFMRHINPKTLKKE